MTKATTVNQLHQMQYWQLQQARLKVELNTSKTLPGRWKAQRHRLCTSQVEGILTERLWQI